MVISAHFPRTAAVITGDIIGSTKYSAGERAQIREAIQKCGEMLQLPEPVQVYRGDSWQVYVPEPARVIKTAVFMRAGLLALAPDLHAISRMSLAIGQVESTGKQGDGEAYILSGRNLEKITRKSSSRLVIAFGESLHFSDDQIRAFQVILTGLDYISTGWTTWQAYTMMHTLFGEKDEEIASGWPEGPITKRTVDKHLQRGGWNVIVESIGFLENNLMVHLSK